MTVEELIAAVLMPLVGGEAFPDVAPEGAPLPRIVYQQVGGVSLTFEEGTLPDRENCRIQVSVWSPRRMETTELAKQVEAAILSAQTMQAIAIGARTSIHESDTGLFGARQDFSIWVLR